MVGGFRRAALAVPRGRALRRLRVGPGWPQECLTVPHFPTQSLLVWVWGANETVLSSWYTKSGHLKNENRCWREGHLPTGFFFFFDTKARSPENSDFLAMFWGQEFIIQISRYVFLPLTFGVVPALDQLVGSTYLNL